MFNFLSNNAAQKIFLKSYPQYKKTAHLDQLRKTEYSRLDKQGHVYLDYTGGNLYSERQLKKHFTMLSQNVFGNPHSTNPTSQTSTKNVEETRAFVLNYFNATNDYYCIFTPNASGSLKIVGESYPFNQQGVFLLSLDNHNSVHGIREFAKNKGSQVAYCNLQRESLKLDEQDLTAKLTEYAVCKNKLFAFPAQSNVSGIKHPLAYVTLAEQHGWDVLLDAAAFAPSNQLDLNTIKPSFVTISFYKIFGYPTGLGCLLIRKDKFDKLVKPWYAGGTIALAAASYQAHQLVNNHERFEDGTLNYLDIPAIKIGLEHINKVGMEHINTRVKCLTDWLIKNLLELKHTNGQPLIKIFGSHSVEERGGTLVLNFYTSQGKSYPFWLIEGEANKYKISIRTGCFCNPGIDEINHQIEADELEYYFTHNKSGDFKHMMEHIGKLRGAVRISVGLVTNFNDVFAFYQFASRFLNKQ